MILIIEVSDDVMVFMLAHEFSLTLAFNNYTTVLFFVMILATLFFAGRRRFSSRLDHSYRAELQRRFIAYLRFEITCIGVRSLSTTSVSL